VLSNPFGQNQGRRAQFSCFTPPNSFSAVPRASALVFMFCDVGLIFGGTEGVRSHFPVLRSRTRFWLYRGRRVPFSYFALSDPFWAVPSATGPVFMFCAPGLILGATEGVVSRFQVLRPRTSFRLYQGVGSHFRVLRSRTHFRRYRGRRFPFSWFALPDSISVVLRASSLVFKFCAPGPVSGRTEDVEPNFHVSRS
jgi:hypothetical protein